MIKTIKYYVLIFYKIKQNSKPVAYPLPLIDDILALLDKSKYFTSLDLISGYWQIPIKEEDRENRAVARGKRVPAVNKLIGPQHY